MTPAARRISAEKIAQRLRHKHSNPARAVYIHELNDAERRQEARDRIAELVPELAD